TSQSLPPTLSVRREDSKRMGRERIRSATGVDHLATAIAARVQDRLPPRAYLEGRKRGRGANLAASHELGQSESFPRGRCGPASSSLYHNMTEHFAESRTRGLNHGRSVSRPWRYRRTATRTSDTD